MSKEDLQISSLSYTKKDFPQIYPEIIDIAHQLTNKWDPAQSNESDPGVVLLKEAAFVADHNNYNIDKNILEAFLPSATQDKSVRNICEVNGYIPRWYVSALGEVTFHYYNKDESAETVEHAGFTIPPFTLVVSDADSNISFTQIEPLTISGNNWKSMDGSCNFIEGTLQQVSVGDTYNITLENLDDNHRIYFPEYTVAINGVWVRYTDDKVHAEYGYWEEDNYMLTRPAESRIYKFDYDSDIGVPYLEFPDDIANIIDSGISITYISTLGSSGNVSANTLVNILTPSSFNDPVTGQNFSFENIQLSNVSAFVNGKDPETIDEMYKSFKHTIGTFDTLVSCQDYANYIYEIFKNDTEPLVSNVYVTDKRTEYNKALNVVTFDEYGPYTDNMGIENNTINFKGIGEDGKNSCMFLGDMYLDDTDNTLYVLTNRSVNNPDHVFIPANTISLSDFAIISNGMTPYDISIYALRAFSLANYNSSAPHVALNKSFTPVDGSTTLSEIKLDIDKAKCICHTIKDPNTDDIFLFKNYTPLTVSITPYNKVDEIERNDILDNVYKTISLHYNPRELEFGEGFDKNEFKEIILASDSRIRDLDVDYSYRSSVMYASSGNTYKEVSVADDSGSTVLIDMIAKNILAGRVCLFEFKDNFNYKFGQSDLELIEDIKTITTEVPIQCIPSGDESTSIVYTQGSKVVTNYKSDNRVTYEYCLQAPNFIYNGTPKNLAAGQSYTLVANVDDDGKEIVDKLFIKVYNSGFSTPKETLEFIPSSTVSYEIKFENESSESLTNESSKTYTELLAGEILSVEKTTINSEETGSLNLNYQIKENETIQILYPNYYSETTYSTYVKYKWNGSVVKANNEYELKAGESLVFKYTTDGISAVKEYSAGTIIRSSFDLYSTENSAKGYETISSSQSIAIRKMMNTRLNSTNIKCYWLTPNRSDHALFRQGEYERILDSNEYFIYATSTLDELIILGSGTKLIRDNNDNHSWLINDNNAEGLDIQVISENGLTSNIEIPWVDMNFNEYPLNIIEMNVITLGEGDIISIYDWDKSQLTDNVSTQFINNEWRKCDASIIITDSSTGEDTTLSKYNEKMIRSRLDIVMSSSAPQILRTTNGDNGIQVMEFFTSTGAVKVSPIDEEGNIHEVSLQSNHDIALLGGNGVNPIYSNFSIYKYIDNEMISLVKQAAADLGYDEWSEVCAQTFVPESYDEAKTDPEAPTDPKTVSHIPFRWYPFSFDSKSTQVYPNAENAYVIPIYLSSSSARVTIKLYNITDRENPIEMEFLDLYEDLGQSHNDNNQQYTELTVAGKTIVYVTPTGRPAGGGDPVQKADLLLELRYDEYIPSTSAIVIVGDPVIITGVNGKLIYTSDNNQYTKLGPENPILKRIWTLIKNSGKPNTVPYLVYKPDPSLEINLDKYTHKTPRGNYDQFAFDNPEILFDKNNIVHDKTLFQIDLLNSTIDIDKDMRNY